MSSKKHFELWFANPLNELEQRSEHGAFLAFMVSFSLFERFVKSKLDAENRNGKEFFDEDAAVLGIDRQLFGDFWDMYRVGIMHYLQPKIGKKDGLLLSWEIAAEYGELPEYFLDTEENIWFIRISPWKWAKLTVRLWESRPDLLDKLEKFPMGRIRLGR